MHQYWYVNSKENEEQYNNQNSMSSLYSQPQINKADEMSGLKICEDWSCRFYPIGSDSPANYMTFTPDPPPFSFGQPIHYAGMMPQGHPANWTPLPSHAGFNYQNLPSPGLNHSTIQGCSHKVILPPYSHRQLKLLNSVTITGVFSETLQDGADR